jgi:hypothetical protein
MDNGGLEAPALWNFLQRLFASISSGGNPLFVASDVEPRVKER